MSTNYLRHKVNVIGILLLFLIFFLALYTIEQKEAIHSETQALIAEPMSKQLTDLIQHSDVIIRGHVAATHSAWNADHTLIESDTLVNVAYSLLGDAPQSLIVRTLGGVLANEDLGMDSSETVTFNPEAEVLLFLRRQGQQYQVVEHLAGAYFVQNGGVIDARQQLQIPLRTFIPTLAQAIGRQGLASTLPINWQNWEAEVRARTNSAIQSYVYKGYQWPGPHPVVKYKLNINTTQAGGKNGSIEDFRNAIIAAANTWNNVTNIDFQFQYDGETTATTVGIKVPGLNGLNEIIFMHQGVTNTVGLGIYFFKKSDNSIIEGDIWLNDDYHWDATGSPDAHEFDVQSGALHELGHLLSLGHDSEGASVMFAYLAEGMLKRTLGPQDIAGIRFIYPCTSTTCNSGAVTTPTATIELSPTSAVATPVPILTPMPSPTFTAIPQLQLYLPAIVK